MQSIQCNKVLQSTARCCCSVTLMAGVQEGQCDQLFAYIEFHKESRCDSAHLSRFIKFILDGDVMVVLLLVVVVPPP